LGRAVDKAGLTASFRVHVNIVSLLTYLLTYIFTISKAISHHNQQAEALYCKFYLRTNQYDSE